MNSRTAILLASLAAAAIPASGEFIIDNFDYGSGLIWLAPPPPGFPGVPGPSYEGPLSGVVGGFRTMNLEVLAPGTLGDSPVVTSLRSKLEVFPLTAPFPPKGILDYSNDNGVDAKVVVKWDANAGGLDVDISNEGPSILVDLADSDLLIFVTVWLEDMVGNTSFRSRNTLLGGAQTLDFPLATFIGGPVDLEHIKSITLTVENPPSADMAFDKVYMFVPETSTMLGMGALAGLFGVWQCRRMRKA